MQIVHFLKALHVVEEDSPYIPEQYNIQNCLNSLCTVNKTILCIETALLALVGVRFPNTLSSLAKPIQRGEKTLARVVYFQKTIVGAEQSDEARPIVPSLDRSSPHL